ncbi:unnamed protein product [Linum trigynum]|uniref:Uncharacterized protein n=1 Tax=Linum trigynum TaxID=586398 RepID=A0AAV2GI15_9ROSI
MGEGTLVDGDVAKRTAVAAASFSVLSAVVVSPCSYSIGNAGCSNQSSKSVSATNSLITVAVGGGIGHISILAASNFILRTMVSSLSESPSNIDMCLVRVPATGL